MNWGLFLQHFIASVFAVKFRIIILLIIACAAIGVLFATETPKYKTSWVVLLPGTERASTINLDNLGEARSNGANAYGSVSISPKNTYKEIALSDAVINSAAAQYGVDAVAFSKPKITLIDQTPAMKFTLIGESTEELAYRANLYNDTFHTTLDALRKNEIERNYQGVENNLAEAKQRLANARQAIVEYQTNSDFISEQQFKRWMDDAESLRTEQTQTEIEASRLEATLVTSLYQLGISSEQAEAMLVLLSNPSIQSNLEQLGKQITQQIDLRSQYAQQNPLRKKIDREVAALSRELRSAFKEVPNIDTISDTRLFALVSDEAATSIQTIAGSLATFDGLNAQSKALKEQQQQYQQRIKAHTQDAATLADLQRDHQIAEAIFSSALAKLDTSRLDIYATYPLTQLLTQPGGTIVRDRLQSKIMILALLMIFALLSLAATLSHMRKTLLEKARDQKTNVGQPSRQFRSQQQNTRLDPISLMPAPTLSQV
ncbi:MAG: hypothetical protein KTR16_01965 [Acidiferrobacterales bacterium]|nr:hypothetical protein [Acidiferrobacterales bacterium]